MLGGHISRSTIFIGQNIIRRILVRLDSRPMAILMIRGGLGNQLFQLSALTYYAKLFNFNSIICDHLLLTSPNTKRDGGIAQFRLLPVEVMVPSIVRVNIFQSFIVQRILYILYRLSVKYDGQRILSEEHLQEAPSLPTFFFIQGSFQDKKYPLLLAPDEIAPLIEYVRPVQPLSNCVNQCLIHIRLTDFIDATNSVPSEMEIFYTKLLDNLENIYSLAKLDAICFSDDLPWAKKIVESFNFRSVICPEQIHSFTPIELLKQMANYNLYVASQSSLIWWAIFLTWKQDSNIQVIHDWSTNHNFLIPELDT